MRWKIGIADGHPSAIAGLWRPREDPDGGQSLSFTMLTVNANDHPLMKRFPKPGDEKPSVVIVPPTEYGDWLSCETTAEARSFLLAYIPWKRCTPSLPRYPAQACIKTRQRRAAVTHLIWPVLGYVDRAKILSTINLTAVRWRPDCPAAH
jgi:putative SOS response-associated peptidase YedK